MSIDFESDALSCLLRAARLVDSTNGGQLIYAALELRLAIEARLHELKEAHEEAVAMKKGAWEIAKIGRNIERAFRIGDQVFALTVATDNECRTIYYTPVSRELRQIGMRLGDALHAKQRDRDYTSEWWEELQRCLRRGVTLLSSTCSGALLGPLLARRGSNRFHAQIKMDSRDSNAQAFGDLVQRIGLGVTHPVRVDYLPSLPDEANWVARLLGQLP